MVCPHCQEIIPDNSGFCNLCGAKISVATELKDQPSSKSNTAIILVVVGLIIIAILFVIWTKNTSNINRGGAVPQTPDAVQVRPPGPQWQHKEDGPRGEVVTIQPRAYSVRELNVPDNMRNYRIQLKFNAEGGSGNDVMVYLLDSDSYVNWKNGHAYRQYYGSGKVTVGGFDVRLMPGKYYIVFSNKMSMFSNKVLRTDTTVEYDIQE